MENKHMGKTAFGSASVRTLEMYYPKESRLFEDPYAVKLLPSILRLAMNIMRLPKLRDKIVEMREKQFPGFMGSLLCRTVYIDDVLKTSIMDGIKTVINLGAGLDMRSTRIPEAQNIQFYEVDELWIQNKKKKRLLVIDKTLPPNVTFIPIDFNKQSLKDELQASGFSNDEKALFIWEGVTQYISLEAFESTLKFIGDGVKGSQVVFTYVLQSFIDNPSSIPELKNMTNLINKKGVNWQLGFNPETISEKLSEFNLEVIEDVGRQHHEEKYLKPMGRDLLVFEIERCVLAKVK